MKWIMIDQLRKIKTHLFHFISLAVLIFVISFTFTVIKSSVNRLEENYEPFLESQNVEDFYFSMGDIDLTYLSGSATVTLCDELDIMYECGLAFAQPNDPVVQNNLNVLINQKIKDNPLVYERIVEDAIVVFEDRYDYSVEKRYTKNIVDGDFIYKFMTITDTISVPYIHEGVMPQNDNEIAIFEAFAMANDFKLNDTLMINDDPYTITGYLYQVDFIYPLFSLSTIQFDPEFQTLVLTNEATVLNLDGYHFTKYHVKGDLTQLIGEVGYNELLNADYSRLGKNMQLINILFPKELNFRIIALDQEVTNANIFIDTFLPVFYGLTLFILILFLSRYIKDNKDDILIFKRLGYNTNEIAVGLLTLPLLLSVFSLLGYLVGMIVHEPVFQLYGSRYYFLKAPFSFDFNILFFSTLLPIVIILGLSYFTIHRTLPFKLTLKKRLVFKYVSLKTLLSSLILFISVGLFINVGLNGNDMFSAFIDETKTGNHYQEMVNLNYYTNDSLPDGYETYAKEAVTIQAINDISLAQPTRLNGYGIASDTTLKRLIDDDVTNNQLLTDGIIISDYLSEQLGLTIGDTLTYQVGAYTFTKEIQGISNELIESNLFMLKSELLDSFDLSHDYYNGIFATDDNYTNPYIKSRIDYITSIDQFAEVLTISTYILNFLLIISIMIGLYLFVLIMIEFNKTHLHDIAILKSLGYNTYEIHKIYTLPLYIIFVIGFLISVPLALIGLDTLLTILMETIGFKLVLAVSYLKLFYAFVLFHIIFVTFITIQHHVYDQVSINEILKKE